MGAGQLNHIRFELVPAINQFFYGLQIPAPASAYQKWIGTDPTDFNSSLINANKANNNLIKPLIRLVKYWNAVNGYVFDSYSLEKDIVNHGYWHIGFLSGSAQLQDYFYDYMKSLDLGWGEAQWRHEKVERAKRIINEANMLGRDPVKSEQKIRQLLPPVNSLAGLF